MPKQCMSIHQLKYLGEDSKIKQIIDSNHISQISELLFEQYVEKFDLDKYIFTVYILRYEDNLDIYEYIKRLSSGEIRESILNLARSKGISKEIILQIENFIKLVYKLYYDDKGKYQEIITKIKTELILRFKKNLFWSLKGFDIKSFSELILWEINEKILNTIRSEEDLYSVFYNECDAKRVPLDIALEATHNNPFWVGSFSISEIIDTKFDEKDWDKLVNATKGANLFKLAYENDKYEYYIFCDKVWLISKTEKNIYSEEELKLLILEEIDKSRTKIEKLKRKFDTGIAAKTVIKRPPIPDDVKIFVWRRDEGKCVSCGSQENIEFDHIIPFSKGGSSTERNLQLLCEICNKKKSNNI